MVARNVQQLDALDAGIIQLLHDRPRIGMLDMSRRLEVARGTVQARLDKMVDRGVVTGFGPDLDLGALGYGVIAFTTIEVVQGRISDVIQPLSALPEVLEVHAIAGQGDLLVRLAARSNQHLMDLLETILGFEDIARTSTAISLATQVSSRVMPLVQASASRGE